MAKWSVQISGDEFDIEDLPKWFKDPELQVVKESDGYYLKSTLFESMTDATLVRTKACYLMELIVGSAKLFRPDIREIKLGSVTEKTPNGHKEHHVLLASNINIRSKVSSISLVVDGKEESDHIPRPAEWAKIAGKNRIVRQALKFWVTGYKDWINLYKVLEVIESDVGGKIYVNGWAPKAAVNRFTQTANSYSALGNDARHAKNHIPPPAKPMNIKEACSLIKVLLEKWIDSKA